MMCGHCLAKPDMSLWPSRQLSVFCICSAFPCLDQLHLGQIRDRLDLKVVSSSSFKFYHWFKKTWTSTGLWCYLGDFINAPNVISSNWTIIAFIHIQIGNLGGGEKCSERGKPPYQNFILWCLLTCKLAIMLHEPIELSILCTYN